MLDSPCVIAAPSSSALALALRSPTDFEAERATEALSAILKHCSKQQVRFCHTSLSLRYATFWCLGFD